MSKRRPILIGCPHYQKLVPGTYECDEKGGYLCGPEGTFLVQQTHCGHLNGRCAQTLCVLHRYNRRGAGSWHPWRIMAPQPRGSATSRPREKRSSSIRPQSGEGDGLDLLC